VKRGPSAAGPEQVDCSTGFWSWRVRTREVRRVVDGVGSAAGTGAATVSGVQGQALGGGGQAGTATEVQVFAVGVE